MCDFTMQTSLSRLKLGSCLYYSSQLNARGSQRKLSARESAMLKLDTAMLEALRGSQRNIAQWGR